MFPSPRQTDVIKRGLKSGDRAAADGGLGDGGLPGEMVASDKQGGKIDPPQKNRARI